MKEKVLKLLTVVTLIIALTSINILFLGYHIVIALADELETQGNNTNIADVQFDAYFKVNNENTHYQEANISDEQIYLYINVTVLENGSVDNAKIRIEDSNFKIKDSNNSNEYVKNINIDTNEIELNSIIYNNSIEIEIPIEFNAVDQISADYFSKETSIILEGTYKEEEDEETLEGEIITRIDWTDDAEVNMSQSIEKFIDLGDNGLLLQQEIVTTVENGELPRETEQFSIEAPQIGETLPTSIIVLENGTKLDDNYVQYNTDEGQIYITNEIETNEDGNTTWNSSTNEYKIIYMYDSSAKDNISTIKLSTNMNSKLFTKENVVKTDEQEITLEYKGNVVSSEKTVTQQLYKGYLYANSANDTTYKENNVIEISNAELTDSIKISSDNSYFEDENTNSYNANNIIVYTETQINKNRFIDLFGESGYINILDSNGNIINTINNESETDEDGNIHITYGEGITNIVFETSKPIKEGQFTIHNIKGILGNTGYSRNQLKSFTTLKTNEVVETNLGTDTFEAGINLLDTTTEATLEISQTSLSTLQVNENVQFTISLKTASEKYDLFKNPVIEITLPSSISNITVNSINKIYADEFNIEYARQGKGDNGENIIRIALSGEQSDYSSEINELAIVVNADIEFSILTASQTNQISMVYTNENGNESSYQKTVDIDIQSKPGMMIYNNISGYNTSGDSIYTIDDEIPVGVLEVEGTSRTVTVSTAIINNYDVEIKDTAIIGRIPTKDVYDGTINTTLVDGISTNLGDVEILYSQNVNATKDDDSWSTDSTDAVSYMIKLDSIAVGQIIAIQYEVTLPESVGYGQSIYAQTETIYTYLGNENTQTSTIGAKSESVVTNNILALGSTIQTTTNSGLDVAISTVSGGSELEDGDSVYEGQTITYTMQITNNTGSDLQNVNVKAVQTNGHLYDLIEEEGYDPNEYEETLGIYHWYDEIDSNEKEFDVIDTLANGDSVTLSYQMVVDEVEGEEQQTYGDITISADNIEENITTIKNLIKQAEMKVFVESGYHEELEMYYGTTRHVNLIIENISDTTLQNVKVTVDLPEGTYMPDSDGLVWSETTIAGEDIASSENKLANLSYDEENRVVTFEIPIMEAEETTTYELYIAFDEFDEDEKEFAFMYQVEGEYVYTSNIATLKILNVPKGVTIEQTASVTDNVALKDEDIFDITVTVTNNEEEELYFSFADVFPDGFTALGGKYTYQGIETDIPIVTESPDSTDLHIFENILQGEMFIASNSEVTFVLTIEVDAEYITEDSVTNTFIITYGELDEESDYYKYTWVMSNSASKEYLITSTEESDNEPWVEVTQVGSPENNAVIGNGEDITYTFTIVNTRKFDITTTMYDNIPQGITVESVTLDGQSLDIEDVYIEGYTISAGGTSTLEISGQANVSHLSNMSLVNNLTVSTVMGDVTSNDITYIVETTDSSGNGNNQGSSGSTGSSGSGSGTSTSTQYTISGLAWVDSNKDGRRDSSETLLSGVSVRVVDANQGTYVDNASATTSSDGQYSISVGTGNYILVFSYDTTIYSLTEYQKSGVPETQNSDVFSRSVTIDGTTSTVGATDVITVSSGNVTNIDIGLTQASTFDLELNKYVSQVVVQTSSGTTQYQYDNETLVKVEISSRQLNNASVVIKYAIKITNTGEVAGYVQNIIDYLPSDLTFSSELNSDWYLANTQLQNNSLSNTAIEPGQSKTVELVLTKTMNTNNTGTIINIAEIGQASNILELSDVDSTPGNNDSSEDDYGRAEVIVSVGTGTIIIFISVIFLILAITGISVFVINKKVLKNDEDIDF